MSYLYGDPPQFADGQVLSASVHLNALASNIVAVKDDLLGVQPMFVGVYQWEFWGVIIHTSNTLAWWYEISDSQTVQIKINNIVIADATHTGPGEFSGVSDISSLGLEIGHAYWVYCTSSADATKLIVWALRETTAVVVPTLATFDDETIPSGAEWNTLSTYLDDISNVLTVPYPIFTRTDTNVNPNNGQGYNIAGSIVHRCKYLRCNLALRAPMYDEDDDGHAYTELKVYIDGVEYAHFRNGGNNDEITGTRHYWFHGSGGGDFHSWDELVDLTDAELTPGQAYKVYLAIGVHGGLGFGPAKYANMYYFGESPGSEEPANPEGWTDLPEWAHGDYVRSSGDKDISLLKENTACLGALLGDHGSAPVRRSVIGVGQDWFYSGSRRWRYLLYKNESRPLEEDEDPPYEGADHVEIAAILAYAHNSQETHVQLESTEGYVYRAYDLDSAAGVFPGTIYLLSGVLWALESPYSGEHVDA
jgi:hypothetical protein